MEPQMAKLERCVWAQTTQVFPRPHLVLLTPGPVSEVPTLPAPVLLYATPVRRDGGRRIPQCSALGCRARGLVRCPECLRLFCSGHVHFVLGEREMCMECSGWMTQQHAKQAQLPAHWP